jgi:hypothetical protein
MISVWHGSEALGRLRDSLVIALSGSFEPPAVFDAFDAVALFSAKTPVKGTGAFHALLRSSEDKGFKKNSREVVFTAVLKNESKEVCECVTARRDGFSPRSAELNGMTPRIECATQTGASEWCCAQVTLPDVRRRSGDRSGQTMAREFWGLPARRRVGEVDENRGAFHHPQAPRVWSQVYLV